MIARNGTVELLLLLFSEITFCPSIIILHQLLELQSFFAYLSRKKTILCKDMRFAVKYFTLPITPQAKCRKTGHRAILPSSAPFNFCFFSSIVRSLSSCAFLYKYSRLSLTSRRSCETQMNIDAKLFQGHMICALTRLLSFSYEHVKLV